MTLETLHHPVFENLSRTDPRVFAEAFRHYAAGLATEYSIPLNGQPVPFDCQSLLNHPDDSKLTLSFQSRRNNHASAAKLRIFKEKGILYLFEICGDVRSATLEYFDQDGTLAQLVFPATTMPIIIGPLLNLVSLQTQGSQGNDIQIIKTNGGPYTFQAQLGLFNSSNK